MAFIIVIPELFSSSALLKCDIAGVILFSWCLFVLVCSSVAVAVITTVRALLIARAILVVHGRFASTVV